MNVIMVNCDPSSWFVTIKSGDYYINNSEIYDGTLFVACNKIKTGYLKGYVITFNDEPTECVIEL